MFHTVSIFVLFTKEKLSRLFAEVSDLVDDVLTDTTSMGTAVTLPGGSGDELQYPQPWTVKEYICLHVQKIEAYQFVIMPFGESCTMCVGYVEQQRPSPVILGCGSTRLEYGIRLPRCMHPSRACLSCGTMNKLRTRAYYSR